MLTESEGRLAEAGLDAVALKPTECDLSRARDLPAGTITVDYEGREHLPEADTLATLATDRTVRVTTPVRADGFDPLGDDSRWDWAPETVERVLVAGHPAYLTDEERTRRVAPRLRAGRERAPDAWVGTESVERVAMAVGGTQYELLSRSTPRDLRRLRDAGFEDEIAVYAPTVLTDDEDAILDAVGDYAARRQPVREALPREAATDASASGRAREVLSQAVRDYALVGDRGTVRDHVARLREAGADTIVGYPARGLDAFLE
jgi:hypothetical protein